MPQDSAIPPPRDRTRATLAGLVALLFVLGGCADDSRAPYADLDLAEPTPVSPGGTSYPVGPYGGEVGDVIKNFPFAGYIVNDPASPTAPTDFGTLALADLRGHSQRFALLVMAETWCVGSQMTAQELALEAERGAAAGGVVLEVLLDGDQDLAEQWVRTYALPVTTVFPLDPSYEPTVGGLEWAIVVDLETQAIVWRDFGSTIAQGSPIAGRGTDELVRRCSASP